MTQPTPDLRQATRPLITVKSRQRKVLEGNLRNKHYRAMSTVNQRLGEIEQEVASAAERIKEIEVMMADPGHYKDSQNVVAVNREYAVLKEKVVELTAEWDGFTAEAEGIQMEYRRAQGALESERFEG